MDKLAYEEGVLFALKTAGFMDTLRGIPAAIKRMPSAIGHEASLFGHYSPQVLKNSLKGLGYGAGAGAIFGGLSSDDTAGGMLRGGLAGAAIGTTAGLGGSLGKFIAARASHIRSGKAGLDAIRALKRARTAYGPGSAIGAGVGLLAGTQLAKTLLRQDLRQQ